MKKFIPTTNTLDKFLKLLINLYIYVLGCMAFAGVVFMAYQIFIVGVTGDFGIYR
jgi:hypothetical protein